MGDEIMSFLISGF